jgi:arginyl-tRNA synthetase
MLHLKIEQRLHEEVKGAFPGIDVSPLRVRPTTEDRFGDYQASGLMTLAKTLGRPPRDLALEVVSRLDVSAWCRQVEVAGPGYLNFWLRPEALAQGLVDALQSATSDPAVTGAQRTVVVDFSSPNVAKPMHVGHIRSTVLGDCLARILRQQGHKVITDNHIGDWGTQFGMLLVGWKTLLQPDALRQDPLSELERLYKTVHQACRENPEQMERARSELVRLQSGDPENRGIWETMQQLSQGQFDAVYRRLGVHFDVTLGESFYNPWLADVVDSLLQAGIARESHGAIAVFSDGTLDPKEDPFLIQRDGAWVDNPVLIRKSDGGYNYATTDLATLDYRIRTWNPDEILYVTDGRQQLHFRQVFEVFRRWQPGVAARTRLSHVWFGSILGNDGKPFKTRSGDTVRLQELLDEAEDRAAVLVAAKRPDLGLEERAGIARVVGLGSVKYQDLMPNRQSDYVFSWDRMLALQGNTAPYLQYQYTRAAKVAREGGWEGVIRRDPLPMAPERFVEAFADTAPAEWALARALLQQDMVLDLVTQDYRPNLLCNHLYELAGLYSRFYEDCPVLKAEGAVRNRRLALCAWTARQLKEGLSCLGIEVVDTM